METLKAKFLNKITVTKTVSVYRVKCPKCKTIFITHYDGDWKSTTIGCINKKCPTAFTVKWK